jgi:hypothetical protein
MPAGLRDSGYGARLNSIDWPDLYQSREGYLFIQDLKEQWRESLHPDYILIDSRTGHTDAGGICTRQLPEAVVVLFFPNDQNLLGLRKVVADIREHSAGGRAVALHFVTSNVPDLDDEDRILEQRFERFQRELGYESLAATIHHYGSLALLNQMVFSVDRPRSRLAQEYRDLVKAISKQNPEDREGALAFLRDLVPPFYLRQTQRVGRDRDFEARLALIKEKHGHDEEVLSVLARLKEEQGNHEEAIDILTQAIEGGAHGASLLRRRGELRLRNSDREGSVADAKRLLATTSASLTDLYWAVALLRNSAPDALEGVAESPALRNLTLEARCKALYPLLWNVTRRVAAQLTEKLAIEAQDAGYSVGEGQVALSLGLIAFGRFEEAARLVSKHAEAGEQAAAFNYAMAKWGSDGSPSANLFRRVIELESASWLSEANANYAQCLALAFWVVGDADAAADRAATAMRLLRRSRQSPFSAWRYLHVTEAEFGTDITEMREMMDGDAVQPRIFRSGGIAGLDSQ